LAKLGVPLVRKSDKLPDLALTSRVYRELLSAFFSADLPHGVGGGTVQRIAREMKAEATSPIG
jgi:hypothetical protein